MELFKKNNKLELVEQFSVHSKIEWKDFLYTAWPPTPAQAPLLSISLFSVAHLLQSMNLHLITSLSP